MFGVPAKGRRYHYYVCGTAFRAGRSTCPGRSVRRDLIERLAVEKLREIVLRPDHVRGLVDLVNEELEKASARYKGAPLHRSTPRSATYGSGSNASMTQSSPAPLI